MTGSSRRRRAKRRIARGRALERTYIHLSDTADATPIPVDRDFWARIGERTQLHSGRLVTAFDLAGETHWEMHPAGDEILYAVSGIMEAVLERKRGTGASRFKAGEFFIVPRGAWHTVRAVRPGKLLAITPGEGTEVRN